MHKYFIFILGLSLVPAISFAQTAPPIFLHSGSGFFVNNEYIVTNAHVVKGCTSVWIKGAVTPQNASVEMVDPEHDLALIKTSNAPAKVAPMRFDINTLNAGDKIFVIGYPGIDGARGIYKFVEAQIPPVPPGAPVPEGEFYISDNVEHGNSGGPVFDAYGNIIGVVVAKTELYYINKATGERIEGPRLGIVIDMNTVKAFLSVRGVYTEWVGSGSLTVDPYIEENATAYIVNILCKAAPDTTQ